jgi:hypothetical protein
MAPKPRARPSIVPAANPKLSRQSVIGVFRPKAGSPIAHHLGWDKAMDDALLNIKRPKGQYQVHVDFSAIVDVTNPGSVIEYHVTLV